MGMTFGKYRNKIYVVLGKWLLSGQKEKTGQDSKG